MKMLKTKTPTKDIGSQFGQDLFTFFNYFKYWPMNGKKGFYVDSGANGAVMFSNTYFYDKCLGWTGLCVEPMPVNSIYCFYEPPELM